ncbi:MAG: DMT family transporter [Desulfovibrionales bacterium]|nr:DMT family transporter [Desulfovibrionales bacterium]
MALQSNRFWRSQLAGYLFISLAIFNFAGNIVAARAMGDVLPPATANMLRWTLATLIILPFSLRAMWEERHILRKNFILLCVVALSGISLFDLFLFIAGQTTSALNIALISTLSPLATAVLARVLIGERNHMIVYVGAVISMVGVAYLVTDGNLSQLLQLQFGHGDLFVIATCILAAAYNVLVKKVGDDISQKAMLGVMFTLGVVFLCPMFIWETFENGGMPPVSTKALLLLTYLAVGASILCYLFWNMAVVILGATRTTLFYYVIPIVSGVLAWVFLGEPVSATQLYGGAIIFIGIILSLLKNSSDRQEPEQEGKSVSTTPEPAIQ